jgi:cysteine desulfurase/selenocysteine lyase
MIREVNRKKATWAPLPEKFEAGTPPIADAIALAKAVEFIQEVGFDTIQNHEKNLRNYLVNKLKNIQDLHLYHPDLKESAAGVVSFSIDNVHPHDIAQYLGDKNICVRAGHHCTQILHREVLQIPASLRVSIAVYNSEDDIDKLIAGLIEAIKLYK